MMFLVVDTNVLFSFFRKSTVFDTIRKLRDSGYTPIAPDFVYSELMNLKAQILKYSGISEDEFEFLLISLKYFVKSVPKPKYDNFFGEGEKISPDKKDAPLFALALAFRCPIWSREPKLKKQSAISVFSDEEILKFL